MLFLPQTAEYALRATLHLASRYPESVRVAELSAVTDAPANYLAKTLNLLARAGVLASTRGPSGGFRLTREPARVNLGEVVTVFVASTPRRCLLGLGACGSVPACATHARWSTLSAQIDEFFGGTTLADLAPAAPAAAGRT